MVIMHWLARLIASQLSHQIILLLKRPLTQYWNCPLTKLYKNKFFQGFILQLIKDIASMQGQAS